MHKSILLSIKPKYVADILNGKKTIEIRKTIPKCDLPIDVYIYCTKDNKNKLCYVNYEPYGNKGYLTTRLDCEGKELNGKVVAKFTVRKVEEIFTPSYITEDDNYYSCDIDELLKQSCLTEDELTNYIGEDNYHFFAYHIEDLVIFDKPKELSEFNAYSKCKRNLRTRCLLCHAIVSKSGTYCNKPLIKAPQNFCYVESEK